MDSSPAMVGEKPTFELLERFASELDRYDRLIGTMGIRLSPVLMPDEPDSNARPMEAEYHDYHRALTRLENLNGRLAGLESRIRL